MGCKKQGAQKQSHCYSKREEACTLLFATHSLDLFFKGSQTDLYFQNKNSGCTLTGRVGPYTLSFQSFKVLGQEQNIKGYKLQFSASTKWQMEALDF